MTEDSIKQTLVENFLKIDEVAGTTIVKDYVVLNDNKRFELPKNRSWFELSVMYGEGVKASLGEGASDRYSGVFQIDICVPVGCGRDELDDKYELIREVFAIGEWLDGIEVTGVTTAREGADEICFRKTVRVNWTCDI